MAYNLRWSEESVKNLKEILDKKRLLIELNKYPLLYPSVS